MVVNSLLKGRYERKNMKLLYCDHCHDLFRIGYDSLRSCECGRVKGRYINDEEAEVSPGAISIVIGNRSLAQAIEDMRRLQAETGGTAGYEEYRKYGYGAIDHAWVRPNSGLGNPHTRLLGDEAGGTRGDQELTDEQMIQYEAAAIIRLVLGADNKDGGSEDE